MRIRVLILLLLAMLPLTWVNAANEKKLCLTMIVKNESKIIERCLNSALKHVDCVSICDTGSTDNTVEIIQNYLQKHDLKGEVHHHEWKNFGHNRSLSALAAVETLKKNGFDLDNTFLLLLDADMLLEDNGFQKKELVDDTYLLKQSHPTLSYYNTRLIRASLPWKCVGVTHEYWACSRPSKQSKLTTLWINDYGDGGAKDDKFERDLRLLTQGLKDEPDNVRYMFYLAQTYNCLRQYQNAIDWYGKRIDKGGWPEEVWYSKLMMAECYEKMGEWEKALDSYLNAYQMNPKRSEPLYEITKHYREKGDNQLAMIFAEKGKDFSYPTDQLLFVRDDIYNYLFDEELSIAAYYTDQRQKGFEALNRLLLNKKVPYYTKAKAYSNMKYYVPRLAVVNTKQVAVILPPVRDGYSQTYNPSSPSIQRTPQGYNVICRAVNYKQVGARTFDSMDPEDNTIRTKNFLVVYDKDLQPVSQHEILAPHIEGESFLRVKGMEDCRFAQGDSSGWFFATRYGNPNHIPTQKLYRLPEGPYAKEIKLDKQVDLQGPDPDRVEKNWLGFIQDDSLWAIYQHAPLMIFRLDPATGMTKTAFQGEEKADLSAFRGSASPIEFDGGYLSVVHEVSHEPEQRYYYHRFVFYDKGFNIQKISDPFIFFHTGIEFCCGMAMDHSGKNVILTFSVEDREAHMSTVAVSTIQKMLHPVP